MVEDDGVGGEVGFGGSPDEGTEEEGVRVGNGEEEAAGIVDGTGGAGEGEKFGEEGAGAVEAGDENAGVDLVEGAKAGASSEESLVGWGVRGEWLLGDWFHWRGAMSFSDSNRYFQQLPWIGDIGGEFTAVETFGRCTERA